jgi:hypothetical protein
MTHSLLQWNEVEVSVLNTLCPYEGGVEVVNSRHFFPRLEGGPICCDHNVGIFWDVKFL